LPPLLFLPQLLPLHDRLRNLRGGRPSPALAWALGRASSRCRASGCRLRKHEARRGKTSSRREAEPGPSAMAVTDVAAVAFFHAELRVCRPDAPARAW